MEENKKKRGWIKDAAIIFLVILLILTFFSNTIMNRSLPEVTTAYVTNGTITTKIRGTGTVTARENYDVTIEQTRKVQSVSVRAGQEVNAGDVLFTLEAGDSSELTAARESLASLEKQYQIMLINASSADYARENRQIRKAQEALLEAQEALRALEAAGNEGGEYTEKLAAAKAKVTELEAEYAEVQAALNAETDSEDAIGVYKQAVKDAEAVVKKLEAAAKEKEAALKAAKTAAAPYEKTVTEKTALYNEKLEILENCKAIRNQYSGGSADYSAVSEAQNALMDANQVLTDAKTAKETALVLYGADYDALVAYAKSMITDKWNSDIAAKTEAAYRAEKSLSADDTLTPAQSTELSTRIADAQAASPVTEAFINANLDVYIPAAAQVKSGTPLATAYNAINAADAAISAAQSSVNAAENRYSNAYSAYWEDSQQSSAYYKAQKDVDAAQKEADAAGTVLKAAQKELDTVNEATEAAQSALSAANESVTEANSVLAEAQKVLDEAQAKLTDAASGLESARQEVKTLEAARKSDMQQAQNQVDSCSENLEDLVFNLEQQKLSDEKSAKLEAMDRQELLDSIDAQKALIEDLSKEDGGNEVKAKVSGVIKSISVSAGYKAVSGDVLATIEVPDLGYTLSFSVTNEQARRLHVGDTTTVSNYYWGSKIEAELITIATDPQNPQSSKRLTFSLTGDVTAGNSLTLSVGDKNANYDMVVPNSALKSDSKGSFILIVTAKNSPLGNRYYASRVDVEVISADDQYSAIAGALEGYESVIISTGGNAPISSGDQVRLADNNA